MPRLSRSFSAGFTLMELLVVISIVLVLASLTFPLAKKGLDAGYRAKCVSNLRTLSVGLMGYAQDNNGELPLSYSDGTYKTKGYWAGTLYFGGYLPSPDVCFCPATAQKFWKSATAQKGLNYNAEQGIWGSCSYAATRLAMMPTTADMPTLHPVRLAKVRRPASTLLLVESAYPKYISSNGQDGWYWLSASSVAPVVTALKNGTAAPTDPGPGTRHGRILPVSFCDGHVEQVDLLNSPVSTFSKASDEPWSEGVYCK